MFDVHFPSSTRNALPIGERPFPHENHRLAFPGTRQKLHLRAIVRSQRHCRLPRLSLRHFENKRVRLFHRQRLNGDRQRARVTIHADLDRGIHSGPQREFGIRQIGLDEHRARRRLERLPAEGFERHLHWLPGVHQRCVEFRHGGLCADRAVVHDGEHRGVLRAAARRRGDERAVVHEAHRDDARKRRCDLREIEQRLRALDVRARHVVRPARLVQHLREHEIGRFFLGGSEALQFDLRDLRVGFVLFEISDQLRHFEFREQLVGCHRVALVHGDLRNVARDLCVERGLLIRAQRPGQRDEADHIAARDRDGFYGSRIGGGDDQRKKGEHRTPNIEHRSKTLRALVRFSMFGHEREKPRRSLSLKEATQASPRQRPGIPRKNRHSPERAGDRGGFAAKCPALSGLASYFDAFPGRCPGLACLSLSGTKTQYGRFPFSTIFGGGLRPSMFDVRCSPKGIHGFVD